MIYKNQMSYIANRGVNKTYVMESFVRIWIIAIISFKLSLQVALIPWKLGNYIFLPGWTSNTRAFTIKYFKETKLCLKVHDEYCTFFFLAEKKETKLLQLQLLGRLTTYFLDWPIVPVSLSTYFSLNFSTENFYK